MTLLFPADLQSSGKFFHTTNHSHVYSFILLLMCKPSPPSKSSEKPSNPHHGFITMAIPSLCGVVMSCENFVKKLL